MLRCVWLIAFAIGCGNPSRATVDSNDGNGITPDAPAEPGQFGAPCTEHTDCDSGYCVEPVGEHGGVCTKTCDTGTCPQDWECHSVHLPQADVKLCVPAAKQLCLACANDTECGGGACLQIDGGGHCAIPCSGQCPTGYTCKADATNSHTGNWCQPVTDSCTCTAALAGAMRTCSKSGTVNGSAATCLGSQMCSATTGWSACTATTPAPETCDGVDNDCNFLIDDGVISGDPSCTNTNAAGSCPGTKQCNGSGIVCVGQTPATEKCNALDDNCNGSVDETFVAMGLGSACTAGVGACTRYGSQRCNSTQDGLVCSAVAASPTTELCNQIDDDCDSNVDENFKSTFSPPYPNPLGGPCTAGFGVCARGGSYVCATNGAGTVCSATADLSQMTTETCNYKDDNCDGIVDNGFKNTSTGFYDTDTNCGACGTDCTTMFTGGQAYGQCVVNTSPQCVMRCNNGYGNLNGSTLDGCEFQIDPTAIYVSVTDTTAADDATCGIGPTGTGTGNHPCKSINQGLLRAVQTSGRTQVLVADGTYNEGVTLVSGKNLLGGYRADTWERHVATTSTVIAGSIPAGSHLRTVVASQINAPTLFEGFVVRGAFNTNPSGNSYAVYVVFADSNLVIRNNQIFGGRGGTGSAGAAGLNGATGANGATYSSSAYDSFTTSGMTGCASSNNRAAYGGGVRSCASSDDVGGGNGGGNNCTPLRSTQNSTATSPALAGQPGAGAGGGTAGAPGSRGYDADLYTNRCDLPTTSNGTLLSMFGTNGQPGGPGAPAPGVGGCSAATGSVVAYEWVGGSGNTGAVGSNGGGGGGGGAGGGATCTFCVINGGTAKDGPDLLGAHGGGGGSGGCGGAGGGSGNAGGGAFGIFVVGTSAPTLTTNSITLGTGGDGGAGGIGGGGGLGGTGTQGGDQGTASILFCTGKGGRGGDGGDGGPGSGGGGGCGGSSFGIFTSGVGTVGCGSNTVSGGSAGTGGSGGFSGGNSGGAGANGVVQNCVSQ